jgi:hypothetical protein
MSLRPLPVAERVRPTPSGRATRPFVACPNASRLSGPSASQHALTAFLATLPKQLPAFVLGNLSLRFRA